MGDKLHCFHFAYECRQRWDNLASTGQDGIRHCDLCRENVYWCESGEQVTEHARLGHCVAVQTPDGPTLGDPGHDDSYREGAWQSRRTPRAFG